MSAKQTPNVQLRNLAQPADVEAAKDIEWCGVRVEDMTREELMAFIWQLDNLICDLLGGNA